MLMLIKAIAFGAKEAANQYFNKEPCVERKRSIMSYVLTFYEW